MARPKPAIPVNVTFSTRTTRGERDAIDAMVKRWTVDLERMTGLPTTAGDNLTAWFRATVRRLAAEQGITVDDPKPLETNAPKRASKRAHKSG